MTFSWYNLACYVVGVAVVTAVDVLLLRLNRGGILSGEKASAPGRPTDRRTAGVSRLVQSSRTAGVSRLVPSSRPAG